MATPIPTKAAHSSSARLGAHGGGSAAHLDSKTSHLLRPPPRRKLFQHVQDILPPLPDGFGPWSPHFTNSIALCTVIRDENETDIREWLQYHKWLGVDHVYLTENNSAWPIKDALKDHIASGFVTYETEDKPHAQLHVYRRCLGSYRTLYNWMAFIDADEYLALRQRGVTLKQFLDGFRHFPGLGVHWVFMGANGHQTRPERGGVLRHYTQCQPEPHDHIKIIANTFFVQAIANNPHTMYFRGRAAPVNEARHPFPYFPTSRECTITSCHAHPGHNQLRSGLRTAARIALYHYVTKSRQDFRKKIKRGHGGGSAHKSMPFFEGVQRGQTDAPMCKELARIADACCPESPATSVE